jgi:hypothetical protein
LLNPEKPEGSKADSLNIVTLKCAEAVEPNSDAALICEFCGKKFSTSSHLAGESSPVIIENPLLTYFQICIIKAHKSCHTKPFECEECGCKFSTRNNLVGEHLHVARFLV